MRITCGVIVKSNKIISRIGGTTFRYDFLNIGCDVSIYIGKATDNPNEAETANSKILYPWLQNRISEDKAIAKIKYSHHLPQKRVCLPI